MFENIIIEIELKILQDFKKPMSWNVVHSLLSNEERLQVLVTAVPGEYQESLHECLTRAYVIMKLFNTDHLINVNF